MSKNDKVNPHSASYRPALSSWGKALGPKPSEADFSALHTFGLRQGSKHALAMAMYMRPEGATDQQVMAAAHKLTPDVAHQGVLHNYRRAYEASGLIARDMAQPKGVYKITLTEKGKAFIERKAAAATQAAPAPKAKAKRKAKAKPVAVETAEPVIEPVAVAPVEPVTLPAADLS